MTLVQIADVILRAIEIRTKSFDWIGCYADEIVKEAKTKRAFGEYKLGIFMNYAQYQKKNKQEALTEALLEADMDINWFAIIDMALYWELDLESWAKNILRQQMWQCNFITYTDLESCGLGEYKKYTAWDETQANEIGRYNTWDQCIFHLNRYAESLNGAVEDWGEENDPKPPIEFVTAPNCTSKDNVHAITPEGCEFPHFGKCEVCGEKFILISETAVQDLNIKPIVSPARLN